MVISSLGSMVTSLPCTESCISLPTWELKSVSNPKFCWVPDTIPGHKLWPTDMGKIYHRQGIVRYISCFPPCHYGGAVLWQNNRRYNTTPQQEGIDGTNSSHGLAVTMDDLNIMWIDQAGASCMRINKCLENWAFRLRILWFLDTAIHGSTTQDIWKWEPVNRTLQ
jgi:hypothetical protein